MRCRKCEAKAVINMRQHRLALCKSHFLDWVPAQTQRFIEKYHMFGEGDRILVAVSGGKDSLALWDILQRLGYQADGLYIGLGIDGGIAYSRESQRLSGDLRRSTRSGVARDQRSALNMAPQSRIWQTARRVARVNHALCAG